VNTAVTLNKIRAATRALMEQKARKITKIVDSTPDYDTHPIEAAYIAVIHTNLESDIRNLAGFTPVAEYGNKRLISEQEVGSVENVRFVSSPDLAQFKDAGAAHGGVVLSTLGTLSDVYPILIFGADAFAVVPLKGMDSMNPVVLNPKPTPSDPLGQRGYVGYKFATAAVILNELWMIRIEAAATKL